MLPNETATVLAVVRALRGTYVFHCHSLKHADKAMMLQMEWCDARLISPPWRSSPRARPSRRCRAPTPPSRRSTAPTNAGSRPDSTVKIGEQGHSGPSPARPCRHNVKSDSANWSLSTEARGRPGRATSRRSTPRVSYIFLCEFHGSTMSGMVKVPTRPASRRRPRRHRRSASSRSAMTRRPCRCSRSRDPHGSEARPREGGARQARRPRPLPALRGGQGHRQGHAR